MLWMFQRVNYGELTNEKNHGMRDLTPREWAMMIPTIALAIFMGVFPAVFLRPMEPAVNRLIERVVDAQPAQVRLGASGRQGRLGDQSPGARRPRVPASPTARAARQRSGTMTEYAAIIPMAIVALSAIAAMLAEAIRQPGERMWIGGSASSAWSAPRSRPHLLWDRDAQSFGVIRSDNFALFINLVLCVVGVLTMLFSEMCGA